MKLYGSLTSPYVRKARVMIIEKQLPIQFVGLNSTADPRVAALNPLGKVPVLERDGDALFDSPVIVEYLDSLKAPALIPATGESRWQVLHLAALADGILDAAVTRLLEVRRPDPQRSSDVLAHQEGKIARALAYADKKVKDKVWLVDDHFTLADIALVVALEYVDFRYPHAWKLTYPGLAHWLATACTRPAFVETQPPK